MSASALGAAGPKSNSRRSSMISYGWPRNSAVSRARCNGLDTTMSDVGRRELGGEECALSHADRSQRAVNDTDIVLSVTQQHEPRRGHGKVTPSRASSARFSSIALRPPPYPPIRPPAATTR